MNPRSTSPGSVRFGFSSGRPTSVGRCSNSVNTDVRVTGALPERAATRLATPIDNPSDSLISTPLCPFFCWRSAAVPTLAVASATGPGHRPGGKLMTVGICGNVICDGSLGSTPGPGELARVVVGLLVMVSLVGPVVPVVVGAVVVVVVVSLLSWCGRGGRGGGCRRRCRAGGRRRGGGRRDD